MPPNVNFGEITLFSRHLRKPLVFSRDLAIPEKLKLCLSRLGIGGHLAPAMPGAAPHGRICQSWELSSDTAQIPKTHPDDIPDVFRRLASVARAREISRSRVFPSPVCGYYMWGRLQRISRNNANGARARACAAHACHAGFVFYTILRPAVHVQDKKDFEK